MPAGNALWPKPTTYYEMGPQSAKLDTQGSYNPAKPYKVSLSMHADI